MDNKVQDLIFDDCIAVIVHVRQAHQDAVKLRGDEREAGLVHGLGKQLLLHLQAAERQLVGADEAVQGAAAVLDGELCVVLLQYMCKW